MYVRDVVHVESDHKPLEMIVLKPLDSAPKRLQRMLLQLQKYNLKVKYIHVPSGHTEQSPPFGGTCM